MVKHISDEILVMYLGCVVEKCAAEELFRRPLHPYTQGLLSAIPSVDIDEPKQRIRLQGELSSPIEPKPGCRFASRCPHADERCHSQMPPLRDVGDGHFVACHRVGA